ncbi:hypothetical protein HPP92_024011 [Vanilla planifolia]|uniref:Uncharacterized protein n=1 Tax=Vanilla planifolia TaxID=51239 RepID=A0A835U9I7_VANPL|nr:hypothetical protein HPP92_024011 [Vanilla planifolia]
MTRAARPPTNKRRKLTETNRWLPAIEEESRGSSCGNAKHMEKVQSGHNQESDGVLHIDSLYTKKYLGYISEAPSSSHRNCIQQGAAQASCRCSSALMDMNLVELLPSCKFHHVRKRSLRHYKKGPRRIHCSINLNKDQRSKMDAGADCAANTEAALIECSPSMCQISGRSFVGCLEAERKFAKAYARKKYQEYHLNGKSKIDSPKNITHDHGSNVDPGTGRGTNTDDAQTECSTLISQQSGKRFAGMEQSTVSEVDRKHADNKMHKFKVRFPLLNEGCLETGRKITKSYERKEFQEQHLKDGGLDLYALHILADAALSLEPDPIFHVEGKKGRQTSIQVNNEHETLPAICENRASNIYAKRVAEQASVTEGFSIIHDDLQLEQLSIKGNVSGECQGSASLNDEHTVNSAKELVDSQALVSTHTSTSTELRSQEFIVYDAADLTCTPKLPIQQINVKYAADLSFATKVSCTWGQLESCSNHHEKSNPKHFRMRKNQSSPERLPCSLDINNLLHESSGSRVIGIVQGSQQKAANLVDVSIKRVENDSNATGMQRSSCPKNGGSRYHHQASICKLGQTGEMVDPSFLETVDSFYSKDESSSVANCGIPSRLISACVAALFMIQACSNTRLPPAEAMEILEHATRNLQPQWSQNLPIYREIEHLMRVIKTQVLTWAHTPSSNLQA